MTDPQVISTDAVHCSNVPEVVPAVGFMGALFFVPLRDARCSGNMVTTSLCCVHCNLNVRYVADVALEPLSPCEVYGASGTALSNTASHLDGEAFQPDSSIVRIPEVVSVPENMSTKVRQGGAQWGHNAPGRAWCLRLGMSASSWDGWGKLHVNPCVAMGYYFSSFVLSSSTMAYMSTGVRGEGHMYYVVLVPLGCYTFVCIAGAISFWRWGPAVAHHKVYQHVTAFASLGIMPICYVGYLGPEATIPWHNNLHWLAVSCVSVFLLLQTTSAGGVPGEHPAEPRTSIREPVLRSSLHALVFLDALSDLALIRSLAKAVCSH